MINRRPRHNVASIDNILKKLWLIPEKSILVVSISKSHLKTGTKPALNRIYIPDREQVAVDLLQNFPVWGFYWAITYGWTVDGFRFYHFKRFQSPAKNLYARKHWPTHSFSIYKHRHHMLCNYSFPAQIRKVILFINNPGPFMVSNKNNNNLPETGCRNRVKKQERFQHGGRFDCLTTHQFHLIDSIMGFELNRWGLVRAFGSYPISHCNFSSK